MMKVRVTIMMVIVLALIAGLAYAGENITAAREENGCTVFSMGPVAYDDSNIMPGPAMLAGTWYAEGGLLETAKLEPCNGVTTFCEEAVALDDSAIIPPVLAKNVSEIYGYAAGGLREEVSGPLPNGCTEMCVGPIAFDNGTAEFHR
jgi:hypothetical protein